MTILKIIKSFIQNWHFFPANIWYYQSKLLPLKQNKYDLIIRLQNLKIFVTVKCAFYQKSELKEITTHPNSKQAWTDC